MSCFTVACRSTPFTFRCFTRNPQLGAKPLSRALPQPSHRWLADCQGRHPFPSGRSERLRWVQDSRAGELKPTIPIAEQGLSEYRYIATIDARGGG